MVFILLSWIYILFISVGMGSLTIGFIKSKNPVFIIVSGLFFQLLFIHFWVLIFPVNQIFYILNSLLSAFLIYNYKIKILEIFSSAYQNFKSWNLFLKILFGFIGITSLMQSSVSPYLPDNESYYIQTILWLNKYGLVKGLGNLHLFFSQMSGWHLLQSSFGFGFWVDFLNDLNGFLLVAISFFSFDRLNHFIQNKNQSDLFIGLIFTSSIFVFRFLDAPSPDLPVYLIFPLMVWVFWTSFKKPEKERVMLLFIFGLLLVLVKITTFPILILPFVLLFKRFEFKGILFPVSILCFISLIAFCSKNYIVTGYLLNPTSLFGKSLNPDWKIPQNLQQLYYSYTSFHAYNSPPSAYQNFAEWTWQLKFNKWFFSPKLHGVFNKWILLLLLVFPFWIRKNKVFLWIYLIGLIQFLILFFTSPQYRFFFHIILVFTLIIIANLIYNIKVRGLYSLLGLSIFPVILPLLFQFNIGIFTNNNFMKNQVNTFNLSYLTKPHKNSQYNYDYEEVIDGNLQYESPVNTYMWLTGDGELPTTNRLMIDYLKKTVKLKPQMRTNKLKDGFKSQKIDE